jgi:MiaB/RimO family radical SAM methylthiotransferase
MSLEFLAKNKYQNIKLGKEVCVITNGCPENRIDGAKAQEFFRQNGWVVTSDFRDADTILFNACALTLYNQERSIEMINRIKARKKPSAELIVWGCLPKINLKRLRDVYHGPTFGSDEVERLNELFEHKTSTQDIHANYLLPLTTLNKYKWSALSLRENGILVTLTKLLTIRYWRRPIKAIHSCSPQTFCIKISTGCLDACSYCAVRFSRGRVKSKTIDTVVREFEEGLERGYKEFSLIGTDIGAYGRDLGANLVALLRKLVRKKGDYKIRLRNIQPRFLIEMLPELRETFQSGKIDYIISAAQSGNNRILTLMNRKYRIEDFKKAIRTLNREFPEMKIRTQLMVGFPGETDEEFQDTVRLLDEVSFDFAEVYMCQPRPGTKAAKMEKQIPQKAARRRYYKLFMKSVFNERGRKKKAVKEYNECHK